MFDVKKKKKKVLLLFLQILTHNRNPRFKRKIVTLILLHNVAFKILTHVFSFKKEEDKFKCNTHVLPMF